MHFLKKYLLLSLLVGFGACTQNTSPQVRVEERNTAQGGHYSLFYPQGLAVRVITSRPSPDNNCCQLSVAAAYTDLDTYQPLDLLLDNGRLLQEKAKVGFLNGALTIVGDTLSISQLAAGQTPPAAQLEQVRRRQGTLLLQELLVWQGRNVKPAGGSLFQRRALVEFANHRFAVVESNSDNLTMKQFGDDLVALGARNAIYLDMGDWDEGWYKEGGRVVVLGHRRTQTKRQSNWLVFTRP